MSQFTVTEFESILFQHDRNNFRYTQDSPVYPDVWVKYLKLALEQSKDNPDGRIDLILTPNRKFSTERMLSAVSESISKGHREAENPWQISFNGETVAIRCNLRELVCDILPLTNWWKEYYIGEKGSKEEKDWFDFLVGYILLAQETKTRRSNLKLRAKAIKLYKNRLKNDAHTRDETPVWSICLNRKAYVSISRSTMSTKADAARRVFDINADKITWAIFDTGIDATHDAFAIKTDNPAPAKLATRVKATYDFTKFRELIASIKEVQEGPEEDALLDRVIQDIYPHNIWKDGLGLRDNVKVLSNALRSGRMLDWATLEPLLRIPHDPGQYRIPRHEHGTHVAGIIGANWEDEELYGMCPGIQLYDIRVLNKDGEGEEFNILAAIQFVRWLNRQKDQLVIHGINLSLSIMHVVESYACGRTPICESCERLVAEGTVIVAAAGNLGQTTYESQRGLRERGFRTVNITDPGNAESVITVGATHRNKPHTYGVSYFSSRGPTGDGRLKPDLVAPGEKIESTVPGNASKRMDGTSMAAPHVSGAAALLLASNREFIGQPTVVKKILCESATDLNRERYFQGHGMLDVLRALQSK